MGLINVDVLKKAITEYAEKTEKSIQCTVMRNLMSICFATITDIENIIERQPIVADVEKLVEKLEEQQIINRHKHHNDEWNVGIEQAIEIVRGGGVNDN